MAGNNFTSKHPESDNAFIAKQKRGTTNTAKGWSVHFVLRLNPRDLLCAEPRFPAERGWLLGASSAQ